ncbi:hypothetical protein AB0M54_24455 [Actinoplanes sp. NPDC051470]|uniref:hypothetical protein n=1 Tax=Actinoplanes sp. NPDC051470 TaxID=3157224 RepID=UPI0034458CE3
MSDITVNLSGTWSAKQRSNNGLDLVAGYIRQQWKAGHQVPRIPCLTYVEYHEWKEPISGQVLVVAVPVIEPCVEADGRDPFGHGARAMEALDQLRKQRGKGSVEDVPSRAAGEVEGQGAFDFGDPDEEPADTNASGEPVPPASAEEELAERREAQQREAGIDGSVPPAAFSGGAA